MYFYCVLLCATRELFSHDDTVPAVHNYYCCNNTTRAPNAVHRTTASTTTTDAFNNRTARVGRVRERL